ncbi:MAG: PaaI family thioesterase [Minwuia sp.]|uniref:PaaI family thioesterase n=1 Tax=Minwuia sp. TaxID=2493630 RepID=UPI003A88B85E
MNDQTQTPAPTGLQLLQAMLAGGKNIATIGETLDFTLTEAEFGKAVFVGHPGGRHLNPRGVVHGGYAATLLDSAVGIAILSALPAGKAFTTLELKVNYVRELPKDGSTVTATGHTIHVGRTTATAEGRIEDSQGRLLAHATTTCLILDIPPARGT